MKSLFFFIVFFFQAEDGIRDFHVTGVQTCALPIFVATAAVGVLDVVSLPAADIDTFLLPYAVASVLFGALSVVFGVSLIRLQDGMGEDRKSTRLNSSHVKSSYAVFCLKKKKLELSW